MAKFGAAKMKQAPLSIEAKRARNRRNSQNFQNRRRREAAEIKARVSYLDDCHRSAKNSTKFLEREFSKFFGPDALKELRHTVHPFEIDLKAFEELHKDIRTKEQKLAEIERQRRYQLGINLMTNASQKSRMNASLKLTQLKLRELVLEGQIKEYRAWQEALEAALGTDPPLAEFYDSSAAIDPNVADDRSSEDRGWQNPGQLEAFQNSENSNFFDMPILKKEEEDPSKGEESGDAVRNYISDKFHSNTSGGWQKEEMTLNGTVLQNTHDRFFDFECSHGSDTANESHDFFGETSYEPSKIEISAAIKTNSAHDHSSEDREWQNPGPLKASQNTDFLATPISERQEGPSEAEERSSVKCDFGNNFNGGSSDDLEELDVDVIDGSPTANTGISTHVDSETTKLRQRRQTLLAPMNKSQRTDVSGGTIYLLDDHFIYNDPKITNSPSLLHTGTLHHVTSSKQVLEGHEDHSQAEESEDAVRKYISNKFHSNTPGGWQKEEMTINGTVLRNTHDRFFDFECSHGSHTAKESHDFFGETRYEPIKIKIQSPPSPLNNPPQLPVPPTEHLFEDHSVDGKWNRALEPSPDRLQTATAMLNTAQQQPVTPIEQFSAGRSSPASSFISGDLAEDYWELDCPAPPNDAGSPTEDHLEPDWLEPSCDTTATTATMDRWTANVQEF
ncbi:hypothetical protein B9Z55_008760 [Caenorhabditis nigoni]|uniref:Uncharacterized protein n=1 Tax=Caenorhabditis nigoni TaxID=1611254 RepID=A0A2G5UP02_9PELO|nr:hypothetical protein B9Z55_008760 [Caenorhabditis nigoni]